MQFLLNQSPVTLDEFAPDTTLLEFLRTERVQRGSKEGCASGDCGACTVVLAEAVNGQLRYRSINSCITYLGAVENCQVITVEGLSPNTSELHPVQQAMVDQHGSQCGFCTPGFVMSLFAMMHQPPQKNSKELPPLEQINHALGGNLCRCTGYRPIIDAAKALLANPVQDQFDLRAAATIKQLQSFIHAQTSNPSMESDCSFFAVPKTVKQLLDLLAEHPDARLVAGSTDLALETTQQLRNLPKLIHTAKVAELRRIEEQDDQVIIGAAVTYSEAEPILVKHFPAIQGLLHRLGSLQVRNQGTLGGNIANASPIGDMPPVLLALNARLILRSHKGVRELPIDQFFTAYRQTALNPGECIESIILPKPSVNSFLRIYKLSKRLDDDISAVCAAIHLTLKDDRVLSARLGFGGMAATPARALQAENALIGKPLTEAGIAEAQEALAQDFSPLSDVRASATYRLLSAKNLLLRAVLEYTATQSLEVMHYAHLD